MENIFNKILEVAVYSSIVQGFFFTLIIFRNKKWEKKSNKILAAILIILSISVTHSTLIDVDLGGPFKIKEPFVLLIGPLLYFYIRELISSKRFVFSDIFHLLPFFIFALIILPLEQINAFKDNLVISNVVAFSVGIWILTIIQYTFYWFINIRLININAASIKMEFSNLEGRTLTWMKNFLHIFGVCLLILTITIPIAIHSNNYKLVDTIVCLSLVATIFVLTYEGLFQEEIFSNISTIEHIELNKSVAVEKNKSEQLNQDNSESMQKLLVFMDEKKPYLEEGLTLTGLAQELNMTRNQLSSLINNQTGENFYKFINKYRIEEVKKLFSDPNKKDYTILAMAYEAGFPSKSSFHNIFKNFTGLTPTEYRNRLQS